MTKRYKWARIAMICITLFVGIGALIGGISMLVDPSGKTLGMDTLLPYFEALPLSDVLFRDYVFAGIMLLIVNGITNLLAAALLVANKPIGIYLGAIFGVTLMLWITIQFVILPANFMSISFFIIGVMQLIFGIFGIVGYRQGKFSFDASQYTNIGTNHQTIVVYFSRTGYTKKVAYEFANRLGCDILQLTPIERISGVAGFWWCGRWAMHRWGMQLTPYDIDIQRYDKVIVCSPVWAFGVSAPIRQFLLDNAGKIKNIEYVLTHFMGVKFSKIAEEMDTIVGTKHLALTSYSSKCGKLKEIK